MDTLPLPLPPRPDLDQYRKRAKELVKVANSTDPDAIHAWARAWIESLIESLEIPMSPPLEDARDRGIGSVEQRVRETVKRKGKITLADAQHLIATAHSFRNWADFVSQLDPANHPQTDIFESAANAVISGDISGLEALVREHPNLLTARSARVHHATLLHYVAANGVEDWRQKTPPNAVAVAKFLLEAGADVDALADTYGGGTAQTTMNLLVSSAHPDAAGLQAALVHVLLDYGAAIDGLEGDGSPLMTALSFRYPAAAKALADRGAAVNNIAAAAALGRLDLVREFFAHPERLAPVLPGLYWIQLPNDFASRNEFALVWACSFGQVDVVEFLLGKGVNPAAADANRMSCLHEATARGHMQVIDLLLSRGAPLEVENIWGGTVLNSTLHFAFNEPRRGVDFAAVVAKLVAAGADVSVVDFPTGNAAIDNALRRRRS